MSSNHGYVPLAQSGIALPPSPELGFDGDKASRSWFDLSKRSRRFVTITFLLGLFTASIFYVDQYTTYDLPEVASLPYFLPSKYTNRHPLHGILAAAEHQWSAKLAAQSTTLTRRCARVSPSI